MEELSAHIFGGLSSDDSLPAPGQLVLHHFFYSYFKILPFGFTLYTHSMTVMMIMMR